MSALKEVVVEDQKALVHAYPIGALGWTWTVLPDAGEPLRNGGPLAPSESIALALGTEAAIRYLESLRGRAS